MSDFKDLIRSRIENNQCPICEKEIMKDDFDLIEDRALYFQDLIKVCKNHPKPTNE